MTPNEMQRRYLSGKTIAQVAKDAGCSTSKVHRILHKLHVPMRQRWAVVDPAPILRARQAGMTLSEIGQAHGISKQRVRIRS